MVAILGYSRPQIFEAVRDMYTVVADAPDSRFHFPVGREAGLALGYPPGELELLPDPLLESFAGVGYPFSADAIRPGDTVLDIGAGAGNDSLIAAHRAGGDGHVIALDLTPAMTRKLRRAATADGAARVSVLQASAEAIPLADESVDAITSNGALNLVPDKRRAVAEMFRVLKPGGRLQIADVVISRPVTVDCDSDPRLWVECVVGATVDEDLINLFGDAGFEDIRVVRTLDYFSHSPSAQTREIAAGFGARSMEIGMQRGERAPSAAWQLLRRSNPRRLLASAWRRGVMGMMGLGLALLACYGTLAAVAILPLLGVGLALNEGLWATAIAIFACLTAVAVVPGLRRHHAYGPPALSILGAGVITYTMFVHYSMVVEVTGFVILASAVAWDIHLRRRMQARLLGLDSQKQQ